MARNTKTESEEKTKVAETAEAEVSQQEPETTPDPEQETEETKTVEVRVLVDCAFGKCGKFAEIPEEQLAAAKANGMVDDHPAAVKAAKG